MGNLRLEVSGEGTRKELADALRSLVDDLHSDNIEEIYNIDGTSYNDFTIDVKLKDLEER